jgi:hypothetical protein
METKDKELLQNVLDALREMRAWVNPDYYREKVLPVVNEIRSRLLYVNSEELRRSARVRKSDPLEVDTVPQKFLDSML